MARLIGNITLITFFLLSVSIQPAIAQLRGIVIDSSDSLPIAGATVSDFYGRVLTKADMEGRFILPQNMEQRVIVTSVGYKRLEYSFKSERNRFHGSLCRIGQRRTASVGAY